MLKIKDEYINSTLSGNFISIRVKDINESEFEKYYNNGFKHIFKKIKIKKNDKVSKGKD